MPVNVGNARARAKLKPHQVQRIREIYRDFKLYDSGITRKLAQEYKVSPACILNLVTGRTYTWVPNKIEEVTTDDDNNNTAALSEESADRSPSRHDAPNG